MIYGNISRPSKRRLRRSSFGTERGSTATAAAAGVSEIRGTRLSLESFFSQPRPTVQLALPIPDEEEKDEGILKTFEDWFVGETLTETFYLNSPWMLRFLRFIIFYTVGILFYGSYEDWDFEDCVNFITQTATTVGYGDIVPTSRNSRWFTCFYSIAGILLVYSTLSDIVSFLVNIVRDRYQKVKRMNRLQVVVRSVMNVLMWIWILFLIPVIGAIIFGYIEGWDFHTAFYFSIISSSSIGYGDYVVTQSSAIWVNLLYIIFACSITGVALTKISSFKRHLETAELKQVLNEITPSIALINAIHKADPQKVTEAEYVLHMLQLEGKVDYRQDIRYWSKRFRDFDVDKDRYLSHHDVATFNELTTEAIARQRQTVEQERRLHHEEEVDQESAGRNTSAVEIGVAEDGRGHRGSSMISAITSKTRKSTKVLVSPGKKSVYQQIVQEVIEVIKETVNPYYQPIEEEDAWKLILRQAQQPSTQQQQTQRKDSDEEDSTMKRDHSQARQIASPYQSALALRQAGTTITVITPTQQPQGQQGQLPPRRRSDCKDSDEKEITESVISLEFSLQEDADHEHTEYGIHSKSMSRINTTNIVNNHEKNQQQQHNNSMIDNPMHPNTARNMD